MDDFASTFGTYRMGAEECKTTTTLLAGEGVRVRGGTDLIQMLRTVRTQRMGGRGVTNAAWVLLPDNIPSRWTRFKGSTALLWLLLSHGRVEDNDGTGAETQRLNPDTGATPRQRELL